MSFHYSSDISNNGEGINCVYRKARVCPLRLETQTLMYLIGFGKLNFIVIKKDVRDFFKEAKLRNLKKEA